MERVNFLKTLCFNLWYFPFKIAIKLPIFIYHGTSLLEMHGQIIIAGKARMGMVKIGKHVVGSLDMKYERTLWQNNGKVIFYGSAQIGSGSRISVNKGATLSIEDMFCITGRSTIICSEGISFGKNCLISWDCLIMDTDFHSIVSEASVVINPPQKISIGNNVWIGCRSMLLKGVKIYDDTIVGAGSTLASKCAGGAGA